MKGDRLTVNIIDGNGKRRTLITPAGQEFKLQNVIGGTTNTPMGLPTLEKTQERFITIISVIIGAFVWVFSIVANYAIFMREAVATGKDWFRIVAYVTTTIAALFPGSGLFILMFWFGFQSFVREYVART